MARKQIEAPGCKVPRKVYAPVLLGKLQLKEKPAAKQADDKAGE